MSLRTPLYAVKGLGSAKEGAHHWWVQRLTSIALVPLMLWFVISLALLGNLNYESAVAWVQSPFVAVGLSLLVVVMFYHVQLGVQLIIEDYVHGKAALLTLLVVTKFGCWAFGLAGIFAVAKIAISG